MLLGSLFCVTLAILSAVNSDAFMKNFMRLGKDRVICMAFCMILYIFIFGSIFFGCFVLLANAFGLVMQCNKTEGIQYLDTENNSAEDLASVTEVYTAFQSGLNIQTTGINVATIAFAASWLLVLISFMLLVCFVEPRIRQHQVERPGYRGLDTEELKLFSVKSKEISESDHGQGQIVTDDECAICFQSLKSDQLEVSTVPDSCNHRFHEQCILLWLKTQA